MEPLVWVSEPIGLPIATDPVALTFGSWSVRIGTLIGWHALRSVFAGVRNFWCISAFSSRRCRVAGKLVGLVLWEAIVRLRIDPASKNLCDLRSPPLQA